MKPKKPHIVHGPEGWRVARSGDDERLHQRACHWVYLANCNRLTRQTYC